MLLEAHLARRRTMRRLITLLLLAWGSDLTFATPDSARAISIAPTMSQGYLFSQPQSFRLLSPSSDEISNTSVLGSLLKDLSERLAFQPDLGAFNDFFVVSLSFDTGHLFNSLLSPWQLFGVELESRFSPFFSVHVAARLNLFVIEGDIRFHGVEMKCIFQQDGFGTGGNTRLALSESIGL